MAVSLVKGQKIDLNKDHPSLQYIRIGLGWDVNAFGDDEFDLDASAFLTNENNQVLKDSDFIFYNNLRAYDGGVLHTGDNRTGEGDGDDEEIEIQFDKLPESIHKVAITVTIHDAVARRQNFGQVSNAYVRVVNKDNEEEILRYNLGEDFSVETALVVCELYRHNGGWRFSAVGSGFQNGLEGLCKYYGLVVA